MQITTAVARARPRKGEEVRRRAVQLAQELVLALVQELA